MKTILTLLVLVLFSLHSFGQYSRSFYTEETEERRLSSTLEIGGEIHFFSIRNSNPTTLNVVYGKLNDDAETSDYKTTELPVNMGNNFVLSGIAQQNNIVTFVLQGESGLIARLSYAQLDLSTNTIANFVTLPSNYKKGYSRSRKVGSDLITYQVLDNGGIQRVSTSILNISSTTVESVNTTELSSVNFLSGYKHIELQIENGIECILIRQSLIRRVSNGNYINATVPSFFPIGSTAIVINSSNQIVLFQAAQYAVFDQSLNPISSGTLGGNQTVTGSQRFFEAYEVNSGYRIYHNSQDSHLAEIDANFNIVNTEPFTDFNAFGTVRIGPAIYTYGQRISQPLSISSQGVLFSTSPSSFAIIQDYLNATPSPFIEYAQDIRLGDLSAVIGHIGSGFSNRQLLESSLKFTHNGIDRSILYSASDYFVGLDANDSIIGYENNYGTDTYIIPGPYTNPADYDHQEMDQYNRSYFVTQQMITDHVANISSGNSNYVMPFGIKYWPAHGEVSKGQAANLAAFTDVNNNGIYDPANGDYPVIYGSHCILSVYHQSPFTPNSSQIETHYYTFLFDCDTSETLRNTIFTRNHLFARGQNVYDSYAGKFYDFDIGNPQDDFMGTHVELGLIYAYNGDNYDEGFNGNMGFNDTIPAFGVMTLKGSKRPNDGVDNAYGINAGESVNGVGFGDGIADNEFNTVESSYFFGANNNQFPANITGMYNIAMGFNPDGSPHLAQGSTPTRFTYFGDSDPLFYSTGGVSLATSYTEANAGNAPGERYTFGGTGKSDLLIGDTLILIEAYIIAVDTINLGNTALYSVNKLFERAMEIKNMFQTGGSIGCGFNFNPTPLEIAETELPSVKMYPNPTQSTLTVELLNGSAMTIEIRDLNGRLVLATEKTGASATIDFSPLENATYLVIVSSELGTNVSRVVKF